MIGIDLVIGGLVAAFAVGAAITGTLGVAATETNPFLNEGATNAVTAGHNDLASGSADVLNGLQLPGIPEFHFN